MVRPRRYLGDAGPASAPALAPDDVAERQRLIGQITADRAEALDLQQAVTEASSDTLEDEARAEADANAVIAAAASLKATETEIADALALKRARLAALRAQNGGR